jgi:hypothetical protein
MVVRADARELTLEHMLERAAELEWVIGGTDCGLGTRVGNPRTPSEGARAATERLWGGDHTHAH